MTTDDARRLRAIRRRQNAIDAEWSQLQAEAVELLRENNLLRVQPKKLGRPPKARASPLA